MQPVTTRFPGRPARSPATPLTGRSGASRCRLSLAARHAMEHPPVDTQGAVAAEPQTRVLQTSCPDNPLLPRVLTLP